MRKTRIGLVLLSLLLAVAIVLPGCSKTSTTTATSTQTTAPKIETVTIGVVVPAQGFGADVGFAIAHSVGIWCDDFNSRGGITLNGVTYRFTYKQYDNNSWDAAATLKAFQQGWQQDGIRIWVTNANSLSTTQTSAWALQQKDPCIIQTFGPCDALLPQYSNVIGISSWPAYLATILAWYGQQHPGAKVAIMAPAMTSLIDAKSYQMIGAEAAGLEIVYNGEFDLATTDWHPVMGPIIAAKPDVIVQPCNGATGSAQGMAAARELGYTGDWISTHFTVDTAKTILPEDYYQGVISPNPDWDQPGNTALEKWMHRLYTAYNAKYPGTWVGDGTNAFFQMSMFETGLKLAQSVEAGAILKAMLAADPFPDPNMGSIKWSGQEIWGTSRLMGIPWPIGIVEGDKIKVAGYTDWNALYYGKTSTFLSVMKELNIPTAPK